MKPNLFIGSSTENLSVANALQENLQYDANVTIWNQGVFNLSSNAVDDLVNGLKNFDFGIFVFNPEDITSMRGAEYSTVRDNVIFELGLFIGKLGKSKVFYVIPKESKDMHLPTDLIGMAPGYYESQREDKNLFAALSPFFNQVRRELKKHIIENLIDFEGESNKAKELAMNKPNYWEILLTCELLDSKLVKINKSLDEIDKGLIIQRQKSVSAEELYDFFGDSLKVYGNLITLLTKSFEELNKAYGTSGKRGNALEIKNSVDRIIQICKEVISWEYDLNQMIPPKELEIAKIKMKGWSKIIISQVNEMPKSTRLYIEPILNGSSKEKNIKITLTVKTPPGMHDILPIFENYFLQNSQISS